VKLHLLDLGSIEYDEGWPLAAAGVSTLSEPAPPPARRRVAIIGALIEHPKIGPVLFDTGAAAAFEELWPPVVQELFAITEYENEHRLDVALQAAGYGLEDIRAIVMSHLHLDHAGGLEFFRGSDVPVYVHADELRKLQGKTQQKGYTLVPTRMYFKNGKIKCEIALAKGKQSWDKRETERRRTADKEAREAIARSRKQ